MSEKPYLRISNLSWTIDSEVTENIQTTIYPVTMSSTRQCLAQLSRLSLSASRPSVQTAASLQPLAQKRGYAAKQKPQAVASKYASKLKAQRQAEKKARKPRTTFREYDIRDADQYALLDAMR